MFNHVGTNLSVYSLVSVKKEGKRRTKEGKVELYNISGTRIFASNILVLKLVQLEANPPWTRP